MSFSGSRIDFFQQTKEFDYLCVTNSLPGITGNYRSVYSALLSINNSTFWSTVFDIDFQYVLALSKVDKDTYRRAMDFFNEAGLFESYEKGVNGYARAKVSLKVLYEKPTGNTVGNTVGSNASNADSNTVSDAHFNKTVNTKTVKPKKQETLIDELNFIEPEFEVVFNTWIKYKKDRRENYKTADSAFVAYKKLKKDSSDNPEIAKLIIENAIAANYAGFFPLKNNNSQRPAKTSKVIDIISQNERLKKQYRDAS